MIYKILLTLSLLSIMFPGQNCTGFNATDSLVSQSSFIVLSEKTCLDPALTSSPLTVGMRRLSKPEIVASLTELFGSSIDVSKLPVDPQSLDFENSALLLTTTQSFVNTVVDESESLLARAFQNQSVRANLLVCQTSDANCARQIITSFIRRAYHRKVIATDTDALLAVYNERRGTGETHEVALQVALRVAISSPDFLFRYVGGNGDSARALSDHELASRLSYFIWGSVPDNELLSLADAGSLRPNLKSQVDRMLTSTKAEFIIENFASRWVRLNALGGRLTDLATYPNFTASIKNDMITETKMLLRAIILNGGKLNDLINADYSFLNERLAAYYGISGITGSAFQKVSLASTTRRGLLGHGSILTLTSPIDKTSVVKRGHLILDKFICASPPPPPDTLNTTQSVDLITARQQSDARLANSSCRGCHSLMDPFGFVLESFDSFGVARTNMPDGSRVDSLMNIPEGKTYFGLHELTPDLAAGNTFKRCFSKNLFTYAIGKALEGLEECHSRQVVEGLDFNQAKFSDIVYSLVSSISFQNEGALDN